MTELKPCPFCGGEARIFALTWSDEIGITHEFKHAYYRIVCQGGCRTLKGDYNTEAEAIEAWNTRATDAEEDKLREDMEDLEGYDQMLRDRLRQETELRVKAESENAELRELVRVILSDMDAWQMVIANGDTGYGKGCLERLYDLRDQAHELGVEVDG